MGTSYLVRRQDGDGIKICGELAESLLERGSSGDRAGILMWNTRAKQKAIA